jgi:DNA-binding FadR family transcriptional regulator
MLEKSFSGKVAIFCALARHAGNDVAMKIMKKIMDAMAYQSAITKLPEPADFAACGDAFANFKE